MASLITLLLSGALIGSSLPARLSQGGGRVIEQFATDPERLSREWQYCSAACTTWSRRQPGIRRAISWRVAPIQAGYSDAAAKRHLDDKAERIAVRDITRIRAGSSLQKPQLRGCVHNRQA